MNVNLEICKNKKVIVTDKKSDMKIYKKHIDFKEFQPLKCWKSGLSYGSVIYFEMKDKVFENALSSHIGSASLWINGDDWEIYHSGILQFKSESIGEADIPLLNTLFLQKQFSIIKDKRKSLDIFFENIEIKVFNTQEDSNDLITFFLPDGSIFYYSDSFYKSFEVDETRYLFWKEIEKSGKEILKRKFSVRDIAEAQAA